MRLAAFLLGLAAAYLLCNPAQAQNSLEYEVKAAYLAKFAPFIDWPNSAFVSPTAPLTICVVGSDPFGADLDRAAAGERYGEHPLAVRRMAALDLSASCQILFASGEPQQVETEMISLKDRPVVTVTDTGLSAHSIVGFVVIGDHVRFDIDEAAADAVGIRISSKLLGLAHIVRQGARP